MVSRHDMRYKQGIKLMLSEFMPSPLPVETDAAQPRRLVRITCRYQAREDRIGLHAFVTGEQETVHVWLTQRLLRNCLPHLLKTVGDVGEPEPAQVRSLQWQQERLLRDKPVVAPVPVPVQTVKLTLGGGQRPASHVITSYPVVNTIHWQPLPDGGCQLVLVWPEGGAGVVIPMAINELRLFLSALCGQWLKGGWPAEVWPLWLRDAAAAVAEPVRLKHELH